MRETVSMLVVCTGNTCRSVMARVMLEHLAPLHGVDLRITTAGTHAVEGMPLSARTLAALRTVAELAAVLPGATVPAAGHRSRQLATEVLEPSDIVVAMEAAHVGFVRRHHPEAAARTGLIRTFARDLSPGPAPLAGRVAALGLDRVALDPADDVTDPAGHDDAAYVACAAELWGLCKTLADRL